jgi:putative NADH-flavin reductase
VNEIRRIILSLPTAALTATALAGICFAGAAMAQTPAAHPLKIVVYGGSGAIGSRIANEAAARGHTVVVVDRSPKAELAPKGAQVVTGDALDPKDVLRNAAGADVLVSAVVVRPAPTPDFALRVVKTYVEALRMQTGAKKTRLFVVGGASSLYNAQGQRIIDTRPASTSAAVLGEVRSAVDSLDFLRTVNDVPWTFFSPAGNIRPGERTGKFRLGTEQIVVDDKGQSAISMEDYAVATLDELEKPQFVNKRFTVGY